MDYLISFIKYISLIIALVSGVELLCFYKYKHKRNIYEIPLLKTICMIAIAVYLILG